MVRWRPTRNFFYFCGQIRRKLTTKKIYLIRHGQTDFNLKGIVQGSGVDAPLNEKGLAQARASYSAYKDTAFDKVYTSVLQRSIQSVQQFIDRGIPHEKYSGLNEISWGHREGQVITPEEDKYYHWVLEQWQQGKTDMPIEGGESPEQVAARQRPVIDIIMSRPEEKNVLVCMHGRAIRILMCVLLNYPLRSMDMFEHANLGLYVLAHTGSMFSVERFNDTAHLNAVPFPDDVKVVNKL